MSLDELNKLLPSEQTSDADEAWVSTDCWLTYHGSIQGQNFFSNVINESFTSVTTSTDEGKDLSFSQSQRVKQAQHDYEILQP